MVDVPVTGPQRGLRLPKFNQIVAARRFQAWAARFPLTRGMVRREGEALFDILAGFCHAQVLTTLVALDVPARLMNGAVAIEALADAVQVPHARMQILVRAGAALGILRIRRGARVALTRRGAALVGVPGLQQMILHHDVLYRDLADPVAFFRGETKPELAGFWPYVFGGDVAPDVAETYSDLMAQSQALVAEDTLAAVPFKGIEHLMDVGGGTGAFLTAASAAQRKMRMTLFDLPAVVPGATARFAQAGIAGRATIVPGSFRSDDLPTGADAISLIRVLYDHSDDTVAALLRKCFAALPAGGRLIISEPMRGDHKPTRAGDVYFAIYTLAMETGCARSPSEIAALCRAAGFDNVAVQRARRPFVTTAITAQKP